MFKQLHSRWQTVKDVKNKTSYFKKIKVTFVCWALKSDQGHIT